MMLICERTATHPAHAGRAREEASGMPALARREFVAIELEVVPFDLNVVTYPPEVVSLGGAAGANALVTPLRVFVPCRTVGNWNRSIQRKQHRAAWTTRSDRYVSRFDRVPARKCRGSPRSCRMVPRFDSGCASTFSGDYTRTLGAHASLAGSPSNPRDVAIRRLGGRDRITGRRERIIGPRVCRRRSRVRLSGRRDRTPGTLARLRCRPSRFSGRLARHVSLGGRRGKREETTTLRPVDSGDLVALSSRA
jgi:hypothetical protein